MAAAPSPSITHKSIYNDRTHNPFGPDDEDQELFYGAIYSVFRPTHAPLSVAVRHNNIVADFSRCVGGIGIFVQDDNLATGVL
jgi:hypothetical protein